MSKKRWKIIPVFLVILAVAGGIYYKSYNKNETALQDRINPQMIIKVEKGNIEKTIATEGYVKAVEEQDLSFPVKSSGSLKVEKIYVKEGDRVKKGQLLMELDKTEAKLRYTQKLNAYDRAKISGSPREIEEAGIDLKLAGDELNNMELTAPFDGIITDIYVDVGDYYTSGKVATIKDTSRLVVEASIEEKDIPDIKLGQKAKVTLKSLQSMVIGGEVTEIADEAEVANGIVTLPVTVMLDKVDYDIKLNSSAQLDIIAGEVNDQIIIPITAIFTQNGREFVMKVVDGKPRPVPVKTGLSNGLKIAVESGLEVGDKILLNTYQQAGGSSSSSAQPRQNPGGFPPMGPVRVRMEGGGR